MRSGLGEFDRMDEENFFARHAAQHICGFNCLVLGHVLCCHTCATKVQIDVYKKLQSRHFPGCKSESLQAVVA